MLHFIHFVPIKVELLSSLSLSRPSGIETTVMLNGEFLFGVGTTEIKTISQI